MAQCTLSGEGGSPRWGNLGRVGTEGHDGAGQFHDPVVLSSCNSGIKDLDSISKALLVAFTGDTVSMVVGRVTSVAEGEQVVSAEAEPWLGCCSFALEKGLFSIIDGLVEVRQKGCQIRGILAEVREIFVGVVLEG
eukprot:6686655-Ditylum_brightwellii.AAC.1